MMFKNFIYIFIFLFASMINAQQTELIENLISSVQKEFSPDKRTVLFSISFSSEDSKVKLNGETTSGKAKDALLKRLTDAGLTFSDSIIVLPAGDAAQKPFGVVTISVANMRTKPEHSAEMATQAILGTPLKVFKKVRDWYLVQTPDNYLGWMDDDGLEPMDESSFKQWSNAEKIIITSNACLGYEKADLKSAIVTDLVIGNILSKTGANGEFAEAKLPDGRLCYVKNEDHLPFIKWAEGIDENNISAGEIISTAKLFMGVPYLWGGTSAKGLDCSGFTKTVFYLNGAVLPRDASQQVHVGMPVETGSDFENVLPGDLLFFGEKATDSTRERITHVAIYLGGKEFIHAAGRVKINSFDRNSKIFSAYRLRTFIRAKRLIPNAILPGIIPVKTTILNQD